MPYPTTFEYFFDGYIVPKARPRVPRGGKAYLPPKYAAWKSNAVCELKTAWAVKCQPELAMPATKIGHLEIALQGKLRGDFDNIIGSLCDALVQAGVIYDDSLKHISKGSWDYDPKLQTGAIIVMTGLDFYFEGV
jgi:Holliday junction resolvase RusA-like endonuclease